MTATDKITLLVCQNGIAAKTFRADGAISYRAGMHFRWNEVLCSSLADLHQTLIAIEDRREVFVIRGEPCDRSKPDQTVRRLVNGGDAAFRDVPRHWIMLDIDGVPALAGVDPVSPEALSHVVGLLPAEFQGVSFIAQWSSSAGLEPGLIKVHLWYWLENPLGSHDLRVWAKGLAPLIDPALFNAVQPHYTARPIFDGLPDPVPARTLLVELERASVALVVHTMPKGPTPKLPQGVASPVAPAPVGGKITDGREQWLLRERYRVLREEQPASFETFAATVWGNFSAACETGPTATSSNGYSVSTVADKCRYDWEKFERRDFDFQCAPAATLPAFVDHTVPLDVGLAQLRSIVRGYLAHPEHTVVRITSGSGKTATLCAELVDKLRQTRKIGLPIVAHFYLSTHNLKGEIASKLKQLDPALDIKNVIGRTPDTCERNDLTEAVRQLRLPIQRVCCDASRARGMEGAAFKPMMRCPHFDNCTYQKQFDDTADVYLFSKYYLQASRRADVAVPDFVIIDEEFISTLVEVQEAGLEDLLKVPFGTAVAARLALGVIRDALAMGVPVLKRLREAGFDAASLRQRALDINLFRTRRLGLNILPGMSPRDIAAQATGIGPEHIGYLALKALAAEIEHTRDEAYSVVYRDSKLFVRLLRDSEVFGTPTLILDATADQELTRAVLPTAKFHAIEVPRKADVVQIQNRRLSKTSLTIDKGQDHTRALVQQSLDRITARYQSGLLVTFKSLEDVFALPATWERAHFGAIRGIDGFKDLETVVIVGTYLPPVQAVEHEAGALAARLPEARLFSGSYAKRERAFRLRNGEARSSVWGHADAFAQRVLEQKREAEMLQAIDRLRLVHAQCPKPVFILSNLPLDLTVDETVTLEQLAGADDILGVLLAQMAGVVPLRASILHARQPGRFSTEKAAERWAAPYTPRGLISTIRLGGVKELRAKGVGQKGPVDTCVIFRGDHPAARAATEHHLGELAKYDGPHDREVVVFVNVPGENRTVGAKIVQFIDPDWRAPTGWKPAPLPPDLYRVLNPPLVHC